VGFERFGSIYSNAMVHIFWLIKTTYIS